MTPFETHCPHCSNSLRVSDPRLVGRRVNCPKCQHPFNVTPPAGSPTSAAPAAAAPVKAASPAAPSLTTAAAPVGNGYAGGHPLVHPQAEKLVMSSRNSGHEDHASPAPVDRSRSPMGISGDIHRLKTNGADVAAELSAFVARMKGRSPQEVLGEIAQSTLTQGLIAACIWTVVAMVVLTILPFGMSKVFPPANKALAADSAQAAPAAAPAAQPGKGEGSTASTAAAGSNPNDPDGKLLKKLNMDETKNADPKVNPLDALGNDLLKDLK